MHRLPALLCCALLSCRAGAADTTTVAFGSCLRQWNPAPILDSVRALNPDLFIFAGDNVYTDNGPYRYEDDPERISLAYMDLGAKPHFEALRESTRLLATWDDHDIGPSDSRIHIVLLDTRSFRGPLQEAPPDARGDRHLGEISMLPAETVGFPLYEITASGLNSAGAGLGERNPYRVTRDNVRVDHFGVVRYRRTSATVELALHDALGTPLQRYILDYPAWLSLTLYTSALPQP